MSELKAAGVPDELRPAFTAAEEKIRAFFSDITPMPERGRINVNGTRFMWTQARGLAMTFRDSITEIFGEKGSEQILYRFGQALGRNEARAFHERFGLTDPMDRLAAGPIYFAYSGWAFVEILPSSAPRPDEDYILTYHHPGSFEAEVFLSDNITSTHPVCFINAGYSSGWCGESFNIPLDAREVSCAAVGDEHCTFIMTHSSKMLERQQRFRELLKEKSAAEITTEELL
jgi:son of sevenless-like protein